MFQLSEPFKVSRRSLAASVFLHTTAITLLCVLGFPGSPLRPHKFRAILVAPALPRPALHTHVMPPAPKQFIAPRLRQSTKAPKLLAPAPEPLPLMALTPPPLPTVSQAPLSSPSAPPVKLGAFEEPKFSASTQVTKLDRVTKVELKQAGFEATEAAASGRTHRAVAIGSFGSAAAGEASAPHSPLSTSAGFGDALTASASAPARALAAAGFGETTVERPSHHLQTASTAEAIPVEILDKPRPAYTEEARRLGIQGEVLLEVAFSASGQLRVLQVIRGLGHGLDEAAVTAAGRIRFRPALRDGAPVDCTGAVHIVFQLAY